MFHELLIISNMKHIIFVITFLTLTLNNFSSNHIKFMGIEVNKSTRTFKDSLYTRGFKPIKTDKKTYSFYGKFANEIVTVEIIPMPKSQNICKIIVLFPKKHTWSQLRADYFDKKKLYLEKYRLDSDYEFFSSPYEEGDGYELRAVFNEKCKYISFFKVEGGHISIEIDKGSQIKITYEDEENINLAQKELKEDALDDI